MTCEELVELVTVYLEDALDPPTAARFTAHLAECEGCDAYLAQMRETVSRLGRLPEPGLTGVVRERMLGAFRDWHRS